MIHGAAKLALALAFGCAAPAFAQNTQAPATTIPGLEHFNLSPTPTPSATPLPMPTAPVLLPTPSPTPRATASAAPRPRPSARPTPTPTPSASPIPPPYAPVPAPAPVPSATPTPEALPTRSAVAPPNAPPATAPTSSTSGWLLVAGLIVVLAAAGAWLWWRRGLDAAEGEAVPPLPAAARPTPQIKPRAPPAPPITPPTLEIALNPKRAGTNLTSAAIEYDVVLTNVGPTQIDDIRLDVRMLTASAHQDATIAALFAADIARPVTPPFALPAGGAVSLGGKAMLPREMIQTMQAGGRGFFVPLVTVNATHGRGQTARAFMVGIDRGEGAKLGPFAVEEMRMHDRVRAILYSRAVDR